MLVDNDKTHISHDIPLLIGLCCELERWTNLETSAEESIVIMDGGEF